jgi:serine/threonine protein kinase/outer membrane protein assembly factor BamD (BamD/ComL family)
VPNPLIGQTVGHYKITEPLGAGGMGVVYRAQDLKLGRMVALKVLPAGAGATDEATERFKREARTASSLNHPNICTIYGFDEHEGQLYMAMELLEGETLDKRMTGRPLELGQVLDIAAQICDAMDAAHASGILHRDIKPANVFITRRGTVKVLDFGLAKLSPDFRRSSIHVDASNETVVQEHFTSMAGTTIGTIAYMSPEQARAEDVDSRTDLFSFGVVLYEMITGRQSFPGNSTAIVFDGILNRDPVAPSAINQSIPPELDRIVAKALEKDRTLRYQTAADMGADLKRLRRDSGSRRVTAASGVMRSGSNVLPPVRTASDTYPAPPGSGPVATASAAQLPSPAAGVASAPLPTPTKRNPWLVGGGLVAVVAIAVAIAFASAAYIARLDSLDSSNQTPAAVPADSSAGARAPAPPSPASPEASPATPATPHPSPPEAPAPAPVSPTIAPAANAAARPAAPLTSSTPPTATTPADPTKGSPSTSKPPVKGTAAATAAPPVRSPAAESQQRLDIARAKIANNLNDQALADLRQIVSNYGTTPAAAEASLLSADLLEKMNRIDDAMAALVEFESRFAGDRRVAESKLRRAVMLGRTRQPKAEVLSRTLLADVVRDFPGTPHALQALAIKMKVETERREFREMDPVLKVEVPAVMVTLRTITEQFPTHPQSIVAFNRLATMYADMNKWAEAAQVLEGMGANHQGNPMELWFRLGEIYERRLKDPARARAAYAKVPNDSPRYGDAQRRLRR